MASALSYWEKHLAKKAPGTARGYRSSFNGFLNWSGKTAEELYLMQRAWEDDPDKDPRESGEALDLAVSYLQHLLGEGRAPGTVDKIASTISVFFKVNKCDGFEIPDDVVPYSDTDGQYVIVKKRIREAWDRTGEEFKLRNRAMLMFAKDVGLRIGDIAEITVEEYLGAEDLAGQTFKFETNGEIVRVRGDGFKRWTKPFVTRKKRRNAYPHIGPEAIEALDAYIEERRSRSGKRYSVTHGGRVEMRLWPVFDESQKLFLGRGGRPLSKGALGQQFERLCGAWAKISAHSFRKFHRTQLEGAGMPDSWINKLQGKATSVYSQPEKTGALTARYIHCYPALRVFEDSAVGRRMIEELQRQVAEQQRTIELMMPAFKIAQRVLDQRRELDKLRDAPNGA